MEIVLPPFLSVESEPDAGTLSLEAIVAASGRLPRETLDRARRLARESNDHLDSVLTRLGLLTERELSELLADALDLAIAVPSEFPTAPLLDGQVSVDYFKTARVIPLAVEAESIVLAMADPTDRASAEAVAFAVEKRVVRRIGCATDIEAAWERLYGEGEGRLAEAAEAAGDAGSEDVERLKDLASEAPVIRLVNQIIHRAIELRASDIHLEPMPGRMRLRYRIDGVLHEAEGPPERLKGAVVSRIKVMAKLNIAERRLSQDGQIHLAIRGQDIDFRVATTPTVHGEAVVLRILDRGSLNLDFETLGFSEALITRWHGVLMEPHGIILVTGPTGSGKTTTLYASLTHLNTIDRKILTIEDPVEYQIEGINQVQVKPQIGLDFAGALRSFLRHDPDIMMIGEIRDLETAQIAVQAALTGHLILSTLHTNDAASALIRLIDLGVEDYLLTSTVTAIAAQRLIRTLCPRCREAYRPLPEMAARLGLSPDQRLYRPVGCRACDGSGFQGRTTIIEMLVMSDAIRQLVLDHAAAGAIQAQARVEGMTTLMEEGMAKVVSGLSTVDEVLRDT